MNDDGRPRRGPRARPVAEAPVEVLSARVDELARSWAIALILLRPLEQIGEIPLGDLAREGPGLCAHAVRALESEAELERMAPARAGAGREGSSAAARLGALAGARDAGRIAQAVEALRGVLWEALLDELRDPPARQVAELADRLGYVCATMLDAALGETRDATPAPRPDLAGDQMVFSGAGAGAGPRPGASEGAPLSTGRARAILVDEREDFPTGEQPVARDLRNVAPQARRTARSDPTDVASQRQPGARPSQAGNLLSREQPVARPPQVAANPLPWDVPVAGSTPIPESEFAEGPSAWIGSIGRQLERFGRDGLPFAVLLVELLDGGRPASRELSGELSSVMSQVERALEQELGGLPDGSAGSLTRERAGRYWLLARLLDPTGESALAERLTRAVRQLGSARGVPLEVAVGTAVCPQDGREAAALAAHADIGVLAARAASRTFTGRPVVLVDDPD